MILKSCVPLLLVGVLLSGCSLHNCAAPDSSSASKTLEEARLRYRRNCGACHGLDARGDGVVASLMTPKPVDLTRLRARYGGDFPTERLVRIIDGRETLRAHGESDMPVWGAELFYEAEGAVENEAIAAWIRSIVDYLETIQVD